MLDTAGDVRDPMTSSERRAAASLALIYALRMLGLFMILPVFALYAPGYGGATPLLIGLAVGVYGLTQAALQIPFGWLSDRFGRKRVILAGLLLFALGSVVAALADTIAGVILGRALQGSGAIAAAVMALGADLTRDAQRTKMMAAIGVSIGFAFVAAFVLGPAVAAWGGTQAIFWSNAAFAALGLLLLYLLVPDPPQGPSDSMPTVPLAFARVLGDHQLLRLDVSVFVLHLIVTANFLAVPTLLVEAGLAPARHWLLYLPVLVVSVALMVPLLGYAERRRRPRAAFLVAISGIALAEALLGLSTGDAASLAVLVALLVLFFAAFNTLEASMPALVSRLAPSATRGTAMGVFSTSQFAGTFAGGLAGGLLLEAGAKVLFMTLAGLALACLAVAAGLRNPRRLSGYTLQIGRRDAPSADHVATRLRQVPGVAEAVVVGDEGVAYLKVDESVLDESALRRCV